MRLVPKSKVAAVDLLDEYLSIVEGALQSVRGKKPRLVIMGSAWYSNLVDWMRENPHEARPVFHLTTHTVRGLPFIVSPIVPPDFLWAGPDPRI